MENMKDLSLSHIAFLPRYDTDENDIISEFYAPALSQSYIYKRAVGYFSSSSLMLAMQGLRDFIFNNGKMFLVIGSPLTEEEFESISEEKREKFIDDLCCNKIIEIYENALSKKIRSNIELFSYMYFTGRLEIKLALKKIGMYHDKLGVFISNDGHKVCFQGSANETLNALGDGINSESIMVFSDTDVLTFSKWGEHIDAKFDLLWANKVKNIKILNIGHSLATLMSKIAHNKNHEYFNNIFSEYEKDQEIHNFLEKDTYPNLPNSIDGKQYSLRPHQTEAIRSWQENNYKGILKLATGSGKTITALHIACKLFDKQNNSLFTIIAVPYQALAEQWKSVAEKFSIHPIICAYSKKNWLLELKMAIANFNISVKKSFNAVIVVNATLKSNAFQNAIASIDDEYILWISDECHHHSTQSYRKIIPNCRFKLGLSATPWEDNNLEAKSNLESIYGSIVSYYSLKNALDDNVLCRYEYYIIKCEMDESELELYLDFSKSISVFENMKENGQSINENVLLHLYLKRTRLLGAIKSKVSKLKSLLRQTGVRSKSLFYCGEGSDFQDDYDIQENEAIILKITDLLSKCGYKPAMFTSNESPKSRESLLDAFKEGQIDCLVAKKVLDEGIDIPECKYAFILASSNSVRQYIQRRGRILRKSIGKDRAIIYDFQVIVPHENYFNQSLLSLKEREERRILEFSQLAIKTEILYV